MKFLLNIIIIAILFGCNNDKLSHVKVHKYKQKSEVVNDDPSDDWIFWYIIMSDNGSCYYYSSPSPVTNYSSITWTPSSNIPYAISDKNPEAEEVEELGVEEVSVEEFGEEMQSDLESDSDSDTDSDFDSDGGDSGESGDSGGGDFGGDGGGGDGGGGGE